MVVEGQSALIAAEDHYLFDVEDEMLVQVVLQLVTQVDDFHVGLLLWNNENGELLASALEPGSSNSIRVMLPVGIYRIGVTALDTLPGGVQYALFVSDRDVT